MTDTTLPTRHVYPKDIARTFKPGDAEHYADTYADAHRVHVVAESYSDRSVSLVPFHTAEDAEAYRKGLATGDQRNVAREDRRPVFVASASPEPVPVKDGTVTVHEAGSGGTAHVQAVITNITATGVSVRVGTAKAKSYRKVGRNRYTSGSSVVTVNAN